MDKTYKDYAYSIVSYYEEVVDYVQKNKKFKLIKLPKINKAKFNSKIRENDESKIRFSEFINMFDYVIRRNFPEEVLNNYYDNISDFGIYCTLFQFGKDEKYAGRYDILGNIINIDISNERLLGSIYHELFHLASTNRFQSERLATGFKSYQFGRTIGEKLNEGYTDLLANRYFENVGATIGYPIVMKYVSALEQVVGKEKMEAYYLTANPGALVNDLSVYDSIENIMFFINSLDYIHDLKGNHDDNEIRLKNVSTILIQWYVKKMVINGENLLDPFVKNKIRAYAWQLPSAVENPKDLKEVYYVDINQIIEEVIEEELKINKEEHRTL